MKVRLVFPSLRFQWSRNIGKCSSLLVSLEIVISTSIRGIFLVPGVAICNGGDSM